MNSNIQNFMKDHRFFQKYLQKNGVVLSSDHNLNGIANSFSINETQLNFAISEYNTTANLELCLSFFLPNFTSSEIRQVISMFEFHYHLFCLKPDENEVFNVIVTNNHISFNSKIIALQMTQNDFEVYPKIIRTLLQPVFIESELDYLISIISLMDFMEQIDNPYASKNVLFIDKESTELKSKDDVFCANYIFNISVGDFSLNIGRETEIRSYSLYEYSYKSDKFKSIYNSLVNLLKKELSNSLDIKASEIRTYHIKLQQMKNS